MLESREQRRWKAGSLNLQHRVRDAGDRLGHCDGNDVARTPKRTSLGSRSHLRRRRKNRLDFHPRYSLQDRQIGPLILHWFHGARVKEYGGFAFSTLLLER